MPYMIDQYVKSTSEKMVDKMALAKEMADKWLIKPSLAKKMVDILMFMADKQDVTTEDIISVVLPPPLPSVICANL